LRGGVTLPDEDAAREQSAAADPVWQWIRTRSPLASASKTQRTPLQSISCATG
jgi:hypothetical protein